MSGGFIVLVFFLQTLLYLSNPTSCIYGYAVPYKSLYPQVKLYTTVGEHVHNVITPLGGSI